MATPSSIVEINAFLQRELRQRQLEEVAAVEAARWLDASGLLKDSSSRPGLPLRNLLRAGEIDAAIQRPAGSYGRWFIRDAGRSHRSLGDRTRGASADVPRRPTQSGLNDDNREIQIRAGRRRTQAAKK
jgi:hypothetical protein